MSGSLNTGLSAAYAQNAALMRLDLFRADPRFAGIDGSGTTIAIVDTGIDLDHAFFGADINRNGVADRVVFQYDFSGRNDANATDFAGHGTHVASIAASSNPQLLGVAPGARIAVLKVFPDSSTAGASSTDIVEALDWAAANRDFYNIVAVNLSLGSNTFTNTASATYASDSMRALFTSNAAVVVASGNAYRSSQVQGVASPSNDFWAWSVGALTPQGNIADFSQRSEALSTVFAPGVNIQAAWWDGGTQSAGGTSMAAPQISGMVALMQHVHIRATGKLMPLDALEQILYATTPAFVDAEIADGVTNSLGTYYRVDALAWGVGVLNKAFAGTLDHDRLRGTSVADAIRGDAGNDTVFGGGGNDTLGGGVWDDQLYGEDGNDQVNGNAGHDVVVGGAGNDTLYGEDDNDVGFGETGADLIILGFGDDRGYGQDGNDTLFGEAGTDLLVGGAGNDMLYGQDGQDAIFGETGNDVLAGGHGHDGLYGQDGNDTLWGETDNDVLNGGLGQDTLYGGAGADIFFFDRPNGGTDMIMDFNSGEGDRLYVQAGAFSAPAGFGLTDGTGFLSGAGARPNAQTATFYRDNNSQALWFDPDGTGPSGAHVVAFLIGNPALAAGDIVFV